MRRYKQAATWQPLIILLGLGIVVAYFGFNMANFTQSVFETILTIFVIFIFVGILLTIYFTRMQLRRTKALSIANIDAMTGIEFENYIAQLFTFRSFSVHKTAITGDYGVDLIAEKSGEKVAIQIKRLNKSVGRSAISDAVAGKVYYKCNKSLVVTNSMFTKNAHELAKLNECKLVDRSELINWIIDFQKK